MDLKGIFDAFGKDLKIDLRKQMIKKGIESNGGNDSRLAASIRFYYGDKGGLPIFKLAMNDYWEYVNNGRRPNKKAPPSAVIERWLKLKGVTNPQKILLDIEIKHKGISQKNQARRKLLKTKKSLTYDKAIKQLSWMVAKSIGKKGTIKRFNYKGSKFYEDVINDGRVKQLEKNISTYLKKQIILTINE
jgi:hypothetical protein